MGGARRFVDRVFHSGGRKSGRDRQSPDIQQPGGAHGQQPNNHQPQLQRRDSGKSSSKAQQQSASAFVRTTLRSFSPFIKTPRSASEATATSHAQSPSQSDTTAVVSGILVPASGKKSNAASSTSSIPAGQDLVLPSGESRASSATLTHYPPGTTGLGSGGGIVLDVHCSPPQETASAGKPENSATAIPEATPPDIVTTTSIATIDSSSQTPDPVSTPASEPETLSTESQEVGSANCISDTRTSSSTVPPAISSHLWQKAIEIAQESLAKYQLPSLELGSLQSQSGAENIQSLVAELETAHRESKDKQWRYKDRQGNEVVWVERLGNIMKGLDKYAKIVDTAIQHHPDVTSLVWAGTRTILQVALNHVEALECFEGTMVTIMDKMAVSALYADIYTGVGLDKAMEDTGKLHEVLDVALPELYAAVIVFAIKVRQYFDARWVKKSVNVVKPFAIEFQPFIDDITGKEKTVQECADMATMERIRGSSETIAEVENLLSDMRADMEPLFRLNEISDTLTENVTVTKKIPKRSISAEDGQLLELLSPLHPLKRHAGVKSMRLENTGTWLLELECFRKWCDVRSTEESERILCCYGIPGAGKTLISSLVIDHLCSQVTEQTSIVCLYADYRDWNNQTLVHILGSFLHQLLTGAGLLHIPDQVIGTLKEVKKQNTQVELGGVLAMLKLISPQLDGLFVCIDALDELEPQTRRKLLDILSNELQLGIRGTRLFFTGQPHMQSEVQSYFNIRQEQEVEIIANENDIRQYLSHKIAEDRHANPDAMDEALETEILTVLAAQSQGMFLLPAFHIDMVLEQTTISTRQKKKETLPIDLHDTFEGAIKRIQQSRDHAELGMKVLLWLHLASRPLKLQELQHALAVGGVGIQFQVDNIPSRKAIVDSCLGLVLVDEETMTVRFVHYSLDEYFRVQSSIYFPDGYSTVAETCLIYLNSPKIRRHCRSITELRNKVHQFPLLEYAACNWGTYAKHQSNEAVMRLALTLPGGDNKPSSTSQIIYASITDGCGFNHRDSVALQFSGIHIGASFGLDDLTKYYCDMGQADLRDDTGWTPLLWAAARGCEDIVRLLVDRNDVDVNATGTDGQSPLSQAAKKGYEAIVRLLLERDNVDVNTKARNDCTPLLFAAMGGHEAVVRLLLERNKVDVNARDSCNYRSPLLWAVVNRHEAVARLLLERSNVNVNEKDSRYGRTPLSWAADEGHEALVRLLLERNDVDVNAKARTGYTPLLFAAVGGHEAVVRLLLERSDVDVNAKDIRYHGQTPLSRAAQNGYEPVIRLLLERNDVDVDATDKNGRSPLSWAAENGHGGVVRLLLEQDIINLDVKDNQGRTALDWAILKGNTSITELLQAVATRPERLEAHYS